MSCECPTSELPGEAAAGERPPSRTSGLQARQGAAHFPRASHQPYQYSTPAPAVVLAPQALRTTASATWPVSEGRRYARAGSAAPSTVSGMRPASLAFNVSAVRASCRLTQLRCWVVPGRDSSSSAGSVRRVPSFHSSVSRKRLGYTWALFLHTSAGENPAGSVPGTQDAAVPAAGAACTYRQCEFHRHSVSTPCAGGVVPGFAIHVLPPIQQWAVPAQAGEAVCLPLDAGLFRSAVGPHSVPPMHPLQSPSSPSHQTASPATLHSLRSFRALGHWETLSRASARAASRMRTTSHASPTRLRDSQQPRPTHYSRPNLVKTTTGITRPDDRKGV